MPAELGRNFSFGEEADLFFFKFGVLSCGLCYYILCIMASAIMLFLLGGIYLQQYLSKIFQPGFLPTEFMHSRGIRIARTWAN